MKKLVLFFFALLIFASLSFSAIPSGYMGINWGSSFDTVNSKFINLTVYEKKISDLTSYVSYLQFSPTPNIDKRIFYFFEGGLAAVKIIYIFGINQLKALLKTKFFIAIS